MSRRSPGAQAPWSTNDLVRLIAVVAAGGVLCVVAWAGAAERVQLDDQTGWVSLAVAGLVVAVAGQAGWLLHGRRAVGRYRNQLLWHGSWVVQHPTPSAITSSGELVAGEGMRRYHRPDCPIARGRGWASGRRSAHESADRTPCGICRP